MSGPQAAAIEALSTAQFIVRAIGERIGDASALKMCYGALNKGTQALWLHLLVAARRLGVHEVLEQQLQKSLRPLHDWSLRQLPPMPPKAYRWVPEMEEIAKTLESVGVTPRLFEGAADVYRFVAGTELGRETPEQRDRSRTGTDVLRVLADTALPAPPDPGGSSLS